MIMTAKRLRRTTIKLSAAATVFAFVGVATAAPFLAQPLMVAKTDIGALQPLAAGPSIQLAKAGPGESEDCVRVTRITAPDGTVVPTNGMVCGHD